MTAPDSQLQPGAPAPAFSLADAQGNTIGLADFAGRSVVVYFYPKAATPGCTTEACDFRDSLTALAGAGYDVVGISSDPLEDLQAFAADQRSEEHTSELQSRSDLVCRLLLEKK